MPGEGTAPPPGKGRHTPSTAVCPCGQLAAGTFGADGTEGGTYGAPAASLTRTRYAWSRCVRIIDSGIHRYPPSPQFGPQLFWNKNSRPVGPVR